MLSHPLASEEDGCLRGAMGMNSQSVRFQGLTTGAVIPETGTPGFTILSATAATKRNSAFSVDVEPFKHRTPLNSGHFSSVCLGSISFNVRRPTEFSNRHSGMQFLDFDTSRHGTISLAPSAAQQLESTVQRRNTRASLASKLGDIREGITASGARCFASAVFPRHRGTRGPGWSAMSSGRTLTALTQRAVTAARCGLRDAWARLRWGLARRKAVAASKALTARNRSLQLQPAGASAHSPLSGTGAIAAAVSFCGHTAVVLDLVDMGVAHLGR